MVGNREVERLLKSGVSQAELAGGPSVAKSGFQPVVTPLPTGPLIETSLKTGPLNHAGNIASGEIATVSPLVQEVLRSPGQPLDPATRAFMEPRFDHDFGHVRMHTDAKAADSARVVCAHAYTMGRNVVFGQNEFAPATHQGRELLAHELAHTIQQRNPSRSLLPQTRRRFSKRVRVRQRATSLTAAPLCETCQSAVYKFSELQTAILSGMKLQERRHSGSMPIQRGATLSLRFENQSPMILRSTMLGCSGERRLRESSTRYDQMEYGAHGVIYKKRGSGRVYANDIAAEDYKELTERYGINVSTDPHRVVLPVGRYAYKTVYEGKLLKKVMEENKLPPKAIHQVAARLEAEAESGEYFTAAALARIKAPRVAGKVAGKAPKETPPTTTTPKEAPAGSEPVPDRIVVGRGEKTGRSTVPDPEGMTTTTLANKSAKPDLPGFLQDAPKDYPHLVGKIKEMFLERMGLTPAGSRAGVNPEGISSARQLLQPGGRLTILQQPTAGETPAQVKTQLKALLPKTEWGDIKFTDRGQEGVLVTAKKL